MTADIDMDLYKPERQNTYFGSEYANDEYSIGFARRRRRCYELSAYALLFGTVPDGTVLIHGTMDGHVPGGLGRIGHAWLLLPDGKVWEPIFGDVWSAADWEAWADPRVERRYTAKQAKRKVIQTEHYGRWHNSEYP